MIIHIYWFFYSIGPLHFFLSVNINFSRVTNSLISCPFWICQSFSITCNLWYVFRYLFQYHERNIFYYYFVCKPCYLQLLYEYQIEYKFAISTICLLHISNYDSLKMSLLHPVFPILYYLIISKWINCGNRTPCGLICLLVSKSLAFDGKKCFVHRNKLALLRKVHVGALQRLVFSAYIVYHFSLTMLHCIFLAMKWFATIITG